MRLLKTKLISEPGALEIEEFDDISVPQYAILSHRWGNDEPTLQDVERGTTTKGGFTKVQQSCDMAKRDGINYIWIDTCCINKESSSELSEAINSMYLWYFKAHRCYAYLADVPSKPFEESQWFTRGWTLQELLAPADLVFFDANWKVLGTKEGLQEEISTCTGIPVDILSGDEDIETCSIAQRMSWAAKRSTKRVEDLAYSLLGIFGINMPLLYGEGERAFTRLQEEIMRVSDDHSLFAWESPDNRGGILAASPAAFKRSGNIVQLSPVNVPYNTLLTSSRGVHLDFPLIGKGSRKLGLALLQCKEQDGSNNQIAIYVTDLTGTMEIFQRVRSRELERLDLAKTRSWQYLARRACIQTSRIIPTRKPKHPREINDIKKHETFDDNVLESLMNLAQPDALLHAAREGHEDDVWLMLTRRGIDIESSGTDNYDEWSALFHAVNSGHEAVAKMLLARGANVNLMVRDGSTPLTLATEKGHEDIVKLLLERGAYMTLEAEHSEQWTIFDKLPRDKITSDLLEDIRFAYREKHGHFLLPVFVWAAKYRRESIMKLLLDRSTDFDLKINFGPMILKWAARSGHKSLVGWLLNRGVEFNLKRYSGRKFDSKSIASLYGEEDFVNLLLENGANIEAKGYDGRTPLSLAAEYGCNNTIKLLLEKGASIEGRDDNIRTPLSWATTGFKKLDTLKLLLEKGADIEARDHASQTPLLQAVSEDRDKDIIRLLLEKGANAEARDNDGRTPLSWATSDCQSWLNLDLLLHRGASVEAKDNNGRTPLSWAATRHNPMKYIKLLLEKGADMEARDNNGQTPLSWAVTDYQTMSVIDLLLEKGADMEAKDNNGRTPLSWVAAGGYNTISVIKLLLEKGADTEAKDNNGRTPLSWAAAGYETMNIIKLLLEKGANIEANDSNGRTPLSWATKHGRGDNIELLLNKGARVERKENNN